MRLDRRDFATSRRFRDGSPAGPAGPLSRAARAVLP
jgi:hypothetical protein